MGKDDAAVARRVLGAAALGLAALALAAAARGAGEGIPGFVPDPERPFSVTVRVALLWGTATSAVLCALLAASARVWARPAHGVEEAPEPAPPGRAFPWLLLAALLVAALLRWPLAHGSLWWDEAWSITHVVVGEVLPDPEAEEKVVFEDRHWARTFFYYRKPTNHVLHNVTARASLAIWRAATGRGPEAFHDFAFRVPSYLAAIATVPLVGLLGWRLGFPRAGVGAAWLLALHPWHLRYGVEGRAYSMVVLFTALSALTLLEALRRPDWRRWLLYGGSQFLLLWTHPFMLYLTVALGAAALPALVARARALRDRVTLVGRLVVSNLLAGMLFGLAMAPNLAQSVVWDDEANGRPLTPRDLIDLFAWATTGMSRRAGEVNQDPDLFPWLEGLAPEAPWLAPAVTWLFAGLAALGLARLLARRGPGRAVTAGLLASVPLTLLVVHATRQLYYPRFLVFALVPLTLALTAALEAPAAWLPRLSPRTRGIVAAACLGVGLAGYQALVWPQTRVHLTRSIAPMHEVADFVRAAAGQDPTSVIRAGYGLGGGMPHIYDPWIRYVHTREELEALCEESRRTARPLLVFYGQEGHNRHRWPDGFPLLDDPSVFRPEARFLGTEARFDYRVLRYSGRPLAAAVGGS